MTSFEEQLKAALSPLYDIERELTGGGMSRVFVATDRGLGRKIVIKVLPPELTAGVNRDRFRREIQVAAQLQHPHIVTLLSAGEDGDLLYYTMPYIEGESLRHALEKGALSVKEVVRMLHDVVDALAYAHARGVIHRDIKPANILRQGTHALVTDFGVAKALNAAMPVSGITTAGMAIGTPAYMAPEQLAGDPAADHRIDIYAVGLLAYELLTGESPFSGPSPQATMAAQLTRVPEPLYRCCPDVPPPLSAIIMQCLAKAPENRPPTAEALMTALDSITTSSGEIKTGTSSAVAEPPRPRRTRTLFATLGALAVLSAVGLYASQRSSTRIKAEVAGSGNRVASVSVATPPSTPPPPTKAPAQSLPVALSRSDSLAIAAAVEKRIAQEEQARGHQRFELMADSITAQVRRMAIDSIIRATLPAGVPVPHWKDMVAPPAEWGGPKRVVVTEPRETRRANLDAFGRALSDSLQRTFVKRKGYSLVAPDSVRAVLATTRERSEVEKALSPDLLLSPSFVGNVNGDTMTVMITIRDIRSGMPYGTRVASTRFAVNDADSAIPGLISSVMSQIESLRKMPTFIRVERGMPMARPMVAPPGKKEQ